MVLSRTLPGRACALALLAITQTAWATAEFVEHIPQNQVYGESPGNRMRVVPTDFLPVEIWIRIGYSFYYTDVAVYYTTDGSDPAGLKGVPSGSTAILHNPATITFIRNEPSGSGNIDWWKGSMPTEPAGTIVKYKIGAWHSSGGPEIFSNNYNCSDGTCDQPSDRAEVHAYKIIPGSNGPITWPGGGYGSGHETTGYPNLHFWKEEAVVGNNYMNVQLDQNGTVYDAYFPGAGCTQGISTRNEGYADGLDTFPPGTSGRGQMHLNQALAGISFASPVMWFSNEGGEYDSITQSYLPDTNVVSTTSHLTYNFNTTHLNFNVQQYDFCPIGITYPTDNGNQPNRFIYIKRIILTNNSGSGYGGRFYYNADFALNGGDNYDFMFADIPRGAMVAYDNTQRMAGAAGEYNPTFGQGDYNKNVSVYLATAVKICDSVGSAGGSPALDSWRNNSSDSTQGWVASLISLANGQSMEIDVAMIGGYDNFASAAGTYEYQIAPVIDWFQSTSMASVQTATQDYWTTWLAGGTTIHTPDDAYDALFKRSLLATALHIDAKSGGIIAGMHNGAYPFVWPRDALYAANTLDRTGHQIEAGEVYRFLKDVAYRDNDTWGKGFWYQKYTTDGYKVWTAPQVDETANVTWGGYYHYLTTGDLSFLNNNYTMFYEAARAMSEDSSINSQLYYDDANKLMHSNNVWEDSFDDFLYSNAAVHRGLLDMVNIAQTTGHSADSVLFFNRAANIKQGMDAHLAWDGENTDISQIGLTYPFESYTPTDARIAHILDRMNGVANDGFGNNHPIMNFAGEFQNLVNRYYNDTYWNGGPWFLSTMWYGQYYAKRQDYNPGKADIDNHKLRLDTLNSFQGPVGFGAEQVAPSNSLLYPNFRLQAAWPNAWESMSFYVDSLMLFLDHQAHADKLSLSIAPKLPTGWSTITFNNVKVGSRAVNISCTESASLNSQLFTNVAGSSLFIDSYIRVPAGAVITSVKKNGSPISYTYNAVAARVFIINSLGVGAGVQTLFAVTFNDVLGDFDHNGHVDATDFTTWMNCATRDGLPQTNPACAFADFDNDTDVDMDDYARFQRCYTGPTQFDNPACNP